MTPRRIVRVERLIGRAVRDDNGDIVGHIEEIRAERRGDTYEVVEYLLGPGALAERLALPVRRWLGHKPKKVTVRWDQLDVGVPESPRLTCPAGELIRE